MQGDENHELEAMMSLSLSKLMDSFVSNINTYPNPTSEVVTICREVVKGKNNVSASIAQQTGKLVKEFTTNQYFITILTLKWKGNNEKGFTSPSWLYYDSIRLNGSVYLKKGC